MDSYPTTPLLNRYCVPDLDKYGRVAREVVSSQMGGHDERMAEVVASIPSAWPAILAAIVLAIALGYMHLCLMQCCAEVILWISILLTVVGLGALGVYLWLSAGSEVLASRLPPQLQQASNSSIGGNSSSFSMSDELSDQEMAYRATAIACWSLSGLALCLVCCLRSSIEAAAACMEVACKAIFEMPSLLLAPVVKAVIKSVLVVGFLYGFALLWTVGDTPAVDMNVLLNSTVDVDAPHISHSTQQSLLILFYMLVAFWILGFISALYEFVVAYAVATYYYAPHEQDEHGNLVDEKDVEGCCAALEGLHIGLFYHAGSLAFGSLIIAILHVIQKVIEYAQLKNEEAGENRVISCVLCICACCIKCLQDVVGFINRNAYIDIAINSNSFCTAAGNALHMVIDLGGAMAILNGATYVFAFFGTAFITVACAAGTYAVVGFGPFADQSSALYVEDPLSAGIVAALVALPVALSFMDVFDMASDTLLYCYGTDLHSGKEDHNAPGALRELLEQYGGHDGHDSGHENGHENG